MKVESVMVDVVSIRQRPKWYSSALRCRHEGKVISSRRRLHKR